MQEWDKLQNPFEKGTPSYDRFHEKLDEQRLKAQGHRYHKKEEGSVRRRLTAGELKDRNRAEVCAKEAFCNNRVSLDECLTLKFQGRITDHQYTARIRASEVRRLRCELLSMYRGRVLPAKKVPYAEENLPMKNYDARSAFPMLGFEKYV